MHVPLLVASALCIAAQWIPVIYVDVDSSSPLCFVPQAYGHYTLYLTEICDASGQCFAYRHQSFIPFLSDAQHKFAAATWLVAGSAACFLVAFSALLVTTGGHRASPLGLAASFSLYGAAAAVVAFVTVGDSSANNQNRWENYVHSFEPSCGVDKDGKPMLLLLFVALVGIVEFARLLRAAWRARHDEADEQAEEAANERASLGAAYVAMGEAADE